MGRYRGALAFWAVFAVGLLWSAPLLSGRARLVFRDGASYYDPQFHFLRRVWQQGSFPLWNPWENGGIDMAVDPTYGLFYPLKLLLLVPVRWPIPYHLFLVAHWALAYTGIYFGLRRWRYRPTTAALASASYALGGPLLSQFHNAVYLVSSAWLPWAWFALEDFLQRGSHRRLAVASIALAMMVLGGDPQAAIHVLLVSFLLLAAGKGRVRRCKRWAGTTFLMVLLAAVQLVPSGLASRHSYRSLYDQPRSIWARWFQRQPDEPAPANEAQHRAGHDAEIYAFSVAPWRWAELLWPSIGGRLAPRYSRWFDTIPAESACWSLSLYGGLVPCLAAFTAWRVCRGSRRRRRATWLVIVSAGAALGYYGVGFLLREIAGGFDSDGFSELLPAAGGLYWLFVQVIPGYELFRYPAKWWLLAALGLSVLSATGIEAAWRRPRYLRHMCVILLATSLLLALLASLCMPRLVHWWSTAPADPFFSPLSVEAARNDLLRALAHTAVTASVAALALGMRFRSRVAILVLGTLADLYLANGWILITGPVPDRTLEVHGDSGGALEPRPAAFPPGRVYRPASRLFLPASLRDRSSQERLVALRAWDEATLYGKYYLELVPRWEPNGQAREVTQDAFAGVVGHRSAVMPADLGGALDVAGHQGRRADHVIVARWRLLKNLGVTAAIVPAWEASPQGRRRPLAEDAVLEVASSEEFGCQVVALEKAIPDPAPRTRRLSHWRKWMERQLADGYGCRVDMSREQWQQQVRRWALDLQDVQANATARVGPLSWGVDRVSAAVDSPAPALVVFPMRFAPAWRAWRRGANGDMSRLAAVRVDGLCLGVVVPPGRHQIVVAYRPTALYLSGVVSALSWSWLGVGLLIQLYRFGRSKRG